MNLELLYKIHKCNPTNIKLDYKTEIYSPREFYNRRRVLFSHIFTSKIAYVPSTLRIQFFDKEFNILGAPLDTISRG